MQTKGQATYEGLQIHVEPMRVAEDEWVPWVRVIERWLCGTVERSLPISVKRVFATEHEAIQSGLARAKMHIDTGQAARRQDGKKGKEALVGESQGHIIQSVTAHHP